MFKRKILFFIWCLLICYYRGDDKLVKLSCIVIKCWFIVYVGIVVMNDGVMLG